MRSFKKMGLLFMVLVIALAGLGVGFAAWTEDIHIEGTVVTGSVDLDIVAYSGTWVYKDLITDEMVVVHGVPLEMVPADYFLVAESYARAYDSNLDPNLPENTDVVIVYDNIFPSVDFMADVVFHYTGSVPAKINFLDYGFETTDAGDAWLEDLEAGDYAAEGGYAYGMMYRTEENDFHANNGEVGMCTQFEFCDYFKLMVVIHLPQDDRFETRTGKAWFDMELMQWNEACQQPG